MLRFVPLLLFVGYYISVTFFNHTHYIDNVEVVHSHPFSSSENHQHSASAFQFINTVSHFVSTALWIGLFLSFGASLLALFLLLRTVQRRLSQFNYFSFLRPPPVLA
jgi:hypothetical protein